MNFKSLIKSDNKVDESFDDLQMDMAEALEEGLRQDDPAPLKADDILGRGHRARTGTTWRRRQN